MRILTTTLLATGLMFGTAGFANAQLGGLLGGDKVTDTVLNHATGSVTGQANTSVLGQGSSILGNSAPGSLTSSTLSGSESITAGRVILGGGSSTDAAIAVGRSRVNSQVNGITGGSTDTSALGAITGERSSSSSLLGGITGSSPAPSSPLGGLVGGGTSSSVLGDITGSNKKTPTSLLGGIVGGN